MALNETTIRELGAEVLYGRLQTQIEELQAEFPHLRNGNGNGHRLPPATQRAHKADAAVPAPRSRTPRKPMSPAQRKAVALRMKKYWAERRAGK